jgi:orotidine-5'-phosphate decarboxylase
VVEVIVALDAPPEQSRRLLDRLPDVRWVKVGPILYTREGPALIRDLVRRGIRVFLDLKWHDIPNTVAGAVEAAAELGVAMATVHAIGGKEMMRAAASATGSDMALVGVTVLTSFDREGLAVTTGRPDVILLEEVTRLARMAMDAGLQGIVCSPLEIETARETLGTGSFIVVPGIRRPSDPVGDQSRTAAPEEAVRRGATHLVVGRPIINASDPAAAFREMTEAAR